MTVFRQIQGLINEHTAKELGTDSYEVTWHAGARPAHQPWQGKVWTMKQLQSICGLGEVTGLHGANCYHDYNPFIPGVSVRTYTDDWLDAQNRKENTPKTYLGKQYTTYEALQRQRRMETVMRKYRRDIELMKTGGAPDDDIVLKQARYRGKMQEYQAFSRSMGLPVQVERVYQDGLGGKMDSIDLILESTNLWFPKHRRNLIDNEENLIYLPIEIASVYDIRGNLIFEKKGSETKVEFTKREVKLMRNRVVSHNHPNGTSFSAADIYLLKKSMASEIRVVTKEGVQYLKQPLKWKKEISSKKKIEEKLNKISIEIAEEYVKLYRKRKINKIELNILISEGRVKIFAERYGLPYGKELFKN